MQRAFLATAAFFLLATSAMAQDHALVLTGIGRFAVFADAPDRGNALKARSSSGDTAPVNFTPFETAYTALTEKLQPLVFELGFLR